MSQLIKEVCVPCRRVLKKKGPANRVMVPKELCDRCGPMAVTMIRAAVLRGILADGRDRFSLPELQGFVLRGLRLEVHCTDISLLLRPLHHRAVRFPDGSNRRGYHFQELYRRLTT